MLKIYLLYLNSRVGTCIVNLRPFNLYVYFSVREFLWEFWSCEFLVYLIPTHVVSFGECTCVSLYIKGGDIGISISMSSISGLLFFLRNFRGPMSLEYEEMETHSNCSLNSPGMFIKEPQDNTDSIIIKA